VLDKIRDSIEKQKRGLQKKCKKKEVHLKKVSSVALIFIAGLL
jgi:hypothetical protein